MRTLIWLGVLLAAAPARADAAGPFDPIARSARTDNGAVLSFDAKACEIRVTGAEPQLAVPLRKVTWSMTKETSGDAVVTARCPGKAATCISGLPRYSFRLATTAREARKQFTVLKRFTTNCTPPPAQTR